jgi:hypothetical protein
MSKSKLVNPRQQSTSTNNDQIASRVCSDVYRNWSQPPGEKGGNGPKRTEPVPTGRDGDEGKITISGNARLIDAAALASPSYVGMLLNASIRDYINQDFSNALDRLYWLKAIVSTIVDVPSTEPSTVPSTQQRSKSN